MDWKAASSPSLRMTFPSCTYTHTPHSILPQPRQVERMRLTSPTLAEPVLVSASAELAGAAMPTAAAVAAAIFANVRRVIVSLPMHPPFLRRLEGRHLLCGRTASQPSSSAACRPSSQVPGASRDPAEHHRARGLLGVWGRTRGAFVLSTIRCAKRAANPADGMVEGGFSKSC